LDADLGRSTWQNILTTDLGRWASASNGKIAFVAHSDSGKASNFVGKVQNDPSAGDIRFCAHRIDGPSKTLAYTYYPPPTNSTTAAGDLHLDYAENWTYVATIAVATPPASAASPTDMTAGALRFS